MKRLMMLIALMVIIESCDPAKKIVTNLPEQKITNVAYGSFPSSKMDVFLPANRDATTPFVILIHGGAWVMGDKIWETPTQDSLLLHGIASININYRFVDTMQTHYPQMLADIDSAVDYCIAHADEWHTRKNNFITSGTSAGAHLSLLYAYTTNKKISAIVAECPPTNLTDTAVLNYEIKIGLLPEIRKMTNASYTPGQPLNPDLAASSPLYHIKNIPALIIHGTGDRTVPYSQATDLDKALTSKNIIHKLITIPGADHDLNMKDPATRSMVYRELIAWIRKYGR